MPPLEKVFQKKRERAARMSAAERKTEQDRIYGGSGRTFEGVREMQEKFTQLENGKDYELTHDNAAVESNTSLGDYMLFVNPSKGTENRLISPPHWRTVTTPGFEGQVRVAPDRAEPFFEVNTKGVGYLKPSAMGASLDDIFDTWRRKDDAAEHLFNEKMLGLADMESFEGKDGKDNLMEKSMHMVQAGLRTEAYWGIAKLKKMVFQGELVTIDELRKRGVITARKRFEPAMAVRLFKINSRIEEVYRDSSRRTQLFKNAFETYNKEEKIKNPNAPRLLSLGTIEDEETFFTVFFERMGANLAVLLNEGCQSLALHSSNVTLAAEIADAETIKHYRNEPAPHVKKKYAGVRYGHIKDARDIAYGLRYLLSASKAAGLHASGREDLYASFMKGFTDVFDEASARKQDTNPENALAWISRIARTVIVEQGNLPPLAHNEIEDWPIAVTE